MNILIVGPHSYIASHASALIAAQHPQWQLSSLSVRDDRWQAHDYSGYDCILYCAAIVHQKERPELFTQYDRVNAQIPAAESTACTFRTMCAACGQCNATCSTCRNCFAGFFCTAARPAIHLSEHHGRLWTGRAHWTYRCHRHFHAAPPQKPLCEKQIGRRNRSAQFFDRPWSTARTALEITGCWNVLLCASPCFLRFETSAACSLSTN